MLKNRQLPSTSSKHKKKKQSPLRDLNTSISSSSSSFISIEPQKGCLRFFSKSPNLRNPSLKYAPNTKPFSRSKENVPKNSFQFAKKPDKKIFSKNGSESMSSMCLTKVPKQKNKNFTPNLEILKKPVVGIDRVGKLASGLLFESGLEKWNSKGAPSKCLKVNPKQKQIMNAELGTHFVEKSTPINNLDKVENGELGIDRVGKLASGSLFNFEFDKPNSQDSSSNFLKENRKLKHAMEELGNDFVEKSTPSNKVDNVTNSTTSITITTPPVQASVSPEINCASSSSVLAVSATKTPACYGAGHIVSGVTDRRKCRSRGILTVGQKESSCTNTNVIGNGRKFRMSLVPFPVEASMHWLLSPCEEVDEDRTNRSSGLRNVSDLCNVMDSSSSGSGSNRRLSKITLLSPSRSPELEGILEDLSGKVGGSPLSASPTCEVMVGNKVRKNRYDQIMENSPFSSQSLGSGNVFRTPQSESTSDRHVGMSCLNASEKTIYEFGYDIDCATEDLSRASLSSKINRSIWDSPDFNFNLPELVSSSDSVNLSQISNAWTNGYSFVSNSRSNEMSPSHMRVSWRDGLPSRIFVMDESDFCRCLSDDKSDANKNSNGKLKSSLSHEMKDGMGDSENCDDEIASLEFVGHVPKHDEKREEEFDVKKSNLYEESISTDGGGLSASGDSDWTACYKNQLFEM